MVRWTSDVQTQPGNAMPTRFLYCTAALTSRNSGCILGFKSFKDMLSPTDLFWGGCVKLHWPVTRGLCPSRPALSVQCPSCLGTPMILRRGLRAPIDHNSQRSAASALERPAPSIPCDPMNFRVLGMGLQGDYNTLQHPKHATASRPSWASRSNDCLLGKGAVMRARVITPYRDCGLAENPRPPSHNDNSRAERTPVSPYICRGTALLLSADNYIGQSVAEVPSRLEFPTRGTWAGFFVVLTPNDYGLPAEVSLYESRGVLFRGCRRSTSPAAQRGTRLEPFADHSGTPGAGSRAGAARQRGVTSGDGARNGRGPCLIVSQNSGGPGTHDP
jgi:hypothetical protein